MYDVDSSKLRICTEKGSLSATYGLYSFSRSKDIFKKALKGLIKDIDRKNLTKIIGIIQLLHGFLKPYFLL